MPTPTTTLSVTFLSESAAYDNTFGWYNSRTGMGGVLFADVEQEGSHAPLTPGMSTATFTVNTADLQYIQFFLVSDGYNLNRNDADDFTGAIKVIQLADGSWAVADVDSHGNVITKNGKPDILTGAGANALFTETSKNAGHVDYASSVVGSNQTAATLAGDTADGPTGKLAWEDLAATKDRHGNYGAPGDADYNDAVFQISIVGGNHAPVANADTASIGEDAGATTINVLANDTDPDAGNTLHVTAVSTAGVLGTVTIAPGGASISYTPAASFQSLAAGETATETFSYTVADQTGATASANVTVTVVGANDAPVVAAPVAGAGNEGSGNFTVNLLAGATDVDHGAVLHVGNLVWTDTGSGLPAGFTASGNSIVVDTNSLAYNAMAQGETFVTHFSYDVIDQFGALVHQTATVTITGTNDAPTVSAAVTGGGNEDTTFSVNLLQNASDVDHGAVLHIGNVLWTDLASPMPGQLPAGFAISGNSITVDATGGAYQGLAQGETFVTHFSYDVIDQFGALVHQTASVTIVGTNDGPVAVADVNGGVVESGVAVGGNTAVAGNPTATGNVLTNDTDVDHGDTPAVTTTGDFTGTYGTLHLNANGTYTYTLNNGDTDTNALAQGEAASDVFGYTIADGHGATSSSTLTINITGTNDQPVITGGVTTGTVIEDSGVPASGHITAVDPDHGAALTWSVVGAPASGNTDYHFSMDSFTVTKGAGAGLTVVLQDDFTDGNPPPSSPPLNPNNATPSPTTYAGIGSFGEANGKLLLDSNNAVSFVGVGNPNPVIGQDAIVKTNIDPTNLTLGLKTGSTFDVSGVFDLILPDNAGEGYGIRLTDRLVGGPGNPPDQPGNNVVELAVRESQTGVDRILLRNIDFASDVTTNLGSITLNTALGADQIRLHLSHAAADGNTVHASFDYLLGGNIIASQSFDSIGATGTIFQGENWTRPEIVASAPAPFGVYGNLSIDQSGTWTYNLDNSRTATQNLAQGQHATDTVSVQVADQYGAFSTTTVTIDVVGTNDAPIMQTAAVTRTLAEDSASPNLTATGQAQFSDVDLTDTHTLSASLQSAALSTGASLPAGLSASLASAVTTSLTDPSTGDGHGQLQWNFALANSATQFLAQGETLTLHYNVTVTDTFGAAATQDVAITITGTNDVPVISGPTTGTVTEDAAAPGNQASGQLTAFDPDEGATQTWTVVGGTASSSADYHFRMDSFTVNKGATVILQDDFSDGLPPPNSPPLNMGPSTYAGIGGFTESGGKLFLDSNNAVPFVGVGTPDPFIGQDAIVRTNIDPANTTNGLKIGQPFTITGVFDLILPDSPREEYGIRFTDRLVGGGGTPPDQQGNNVVELVVREGLSGNLQVALRNLDFQNDSTTNIQFINLTPPPGADQIKLVLDHSASDGTALHASFQYMSGGVVVGTTQTFSAVGTVFQGENWGRAELVADAPAFTDSIKSGSYGTLDVSQSGAWTYVVNNGLATTQSLSAGQTAVDSFTIQVTDDHGATATTPINVTVVGTNDGPVIQTSAAARTLPEDSASPNLTATGQAQFSDADLADTHTVSTALLTTSGPLSPTVLPLLQNALTATLFDPATGDGHGQYQWNFSLDNSAVQYLGAGQTLTVNYRATVTDTSPFAGTHASASQNIVITITGVNDAPVAQADSGSVVEAGTLPNGDQPTVGNSAASGNVLFNDTDVENDFVQVQGLAAGVSNVPLVGNLGVAVAGTYGALQVFSNGTWGYQLDNTNPLTNALAQNQHVTDVFTYTMNDSHGGTANQTITIDVTGTNDAPTVSSPFRLEVLEGSHTHQFDLLTNAGDPEGNSFHVANVHWLEVPNSLPPGITVNADGHTISIDTDSAAFTGLASGAFFDVNVAYDLVDSFGAVSHQSGTVRPVGIDVVGGDEFRVNTYTDNLQYGPSLAALTDGGFVVTWTSRGQDGSGDGVYGQLYDGNGAATGSEFQINTYTADFQASPSVVGLANGGFAVSWWSQNQDGGAPVDGSARGVYERVYDANGAPLTGEIQVNTYIHGPQELPSVAALSDGSFVNTWSSYGQDGSIWGVYGKHYDANGNAISGEFQINTYTPEVQTNVSTTGLANGGYVATWMSLAFSSPANGQDGSGAGIYGQLYDANDHRIGGEFHINSYTAGDQMYPTVASLADGGFVVTWTSFGGEDGDGAGIFAQRYDSTGAVVGGEFQVNTYTADDQRSQSVTGLEDGGFMVMWSSSGEDGDGVGVYGRRFDAAGNAAGGEFRISESTAGDQRVDGEAGKPALDQINNGDVVAGWYGQPSVSGDEAYARILSLDANHETLIVHNGFTFDLNVAHQGAVQFEGPTGTLKFETTNFTGTVDGFVTNAEHFDFSALTGGNASVIGVMAGDALAAHSIGWVTSGNDTVVYVNASDSSEDITIAPDMAVHLLNVTQLHANDFIV